MAGLHLGLEAGHEGVEAGEVGVVEVAGVDLGRPAVVRVPGVVQILPLSATTLRLHFWRPRLPRLHLR